MTKKQEVDKAIEDSGEMTNEMEWAEYRERVAKHKCTCDLLTPFGHVTCPECNE